MTHFWCCICPRIEIWSVFAEIFHMLDIQTKRKIGRKIIRCLKLLLLDNSGPILAAADEVQLQWPFLVFHCSWIDWCEAFAEIFYVLNIQTRRKNARKIIWCLTLGLLMMLGPIQSCQLLVLKFSSNDPFFVLNLPMNLNMQCFCCNFLCAWHSSKGDKIVVSGSLWPYPSCCCWSSTPNIFLWGAVQGVGQPLQMPQLSLHACFMQWLSC